MLNEYEITQYKKEQAIWFESFDDLAYEEEYISNKTKELERHNFRTIMLNDVRQKEIIWTYKGASAFCWNVGEDKIKRLMEKHGIKPDVVRCTTTKIRIAGNYDFLDETGFKNGWTALTLLDFRKKYLEDFRPKD